MGGILTPSPSLRFISSLSGAAATHDFTLNNAFDHHLFLLQNIASANDAVNLTVRTSADGTTFDAGASNYRSNGGGLATSIVLNNGATLGNQADESYCGDLLFYRPSDTTFTMCTGTAIMRSSAPGIINTATGGYRLSAAAVLAIRFLMSAGNIASGRIDYFGIKANG